MKKLLFAALHLMLAAIAGHGQENPSPVFQNHILPDSVVEITTVLPGTLPQKVTVGVTGGWAIMDGDICLGRIGDLQNQAHERGVAIKGNNFRWPMGVIPYEIGPGFAPQSEAVIRAAVDYINGSTNLLLTPASTEADRLRFLPSFICNYSSSIGRGGGLQWINLCEDFANGNNVEAWFPTIVHEIGHAAGLYHEQARADRDNFITINWLNIAPGLQFNFFKHDLDGIDLNTYDFGSLMHYGRFDYAIDMTVPTISANNGNINFGKATEFSDGDISAINLLYPIPFCPSGLALSEKIPFVNRPLVFEAGQIVSSTATIHAGNRITFDGGFAVEFSPGFEAEKRFSEGFFLAVVEGCGGTYHSLAPPNNGRAGKDAPPENDPRSNGRAADPGGVAVTPNPFSGSTEISFSVDSPQAVSVQIFTLTGQLVATPLAGQALEAGGHRCTFEAGGLPSGTYVVVVQKGGDRTAKRVVLVQ